MRLYILFIVCILVFAVYGMARIASTVTTQIEQTTQSFNK